MLAAAGELGLHQSTVGRRISALEAYLQLRLLDRRRDGCRLTEAGSSLLAQAQRVAAEAETFDRLVAERRRQLSGTIRVTASEIIAEHVITPLLSEFFEQYHDIKVELIATDRRLDLARGEADIAIRGTYKPNEPGVVVRKLAGGRWSVYCSHRYAAKRGTPMRTQDLDAHVIIGADGALAKHLPYVWLAENAPLAKVRGVCASLINAVSAIRSGHGVGPLPYWATAIYGQDLIECFSLPQFNYGYYLMTRAGTKDLPRVKAFTEFMVAHAPVLRRILESRAAARKTGTD